MTINKLAIIGGSGLYDVEEFKDRELLDLSTPWGKPSDKILKTNYNNNEVFQKPQLKSSSRSKDIGLCFFSDDVTFVQHCRNVYKTYIK